MLIEMLRAKIHRVTVTQADVNYEGSIEIDPVLMDAAGIMQYERVHVWNVSRPARLSTYAIRGVRGARQIKTNGGAALYNLVGDSIIIAAFGQFSPEEVDNMLEASADGAGGPKVVLANSDNTINKIMYGSGLEAIELNQ
jgi:aspartate 1-decarboxylase